MPIIEVARLDAIVQALLSAPPAPFPADPEQTEAIPNVPGLYGIFLNRDIDVAKDLIRDRCLRAGRGGILRKGNLHGNLRSRIYDQGLMGGGQNAQADLVQIVQDRGYAQNRADAQQWIINNCYVRWISIPFDDRFFTWAEHRLLSVLQPIWGS